MKCGSDATDVGAGEFTDSCSASASAEWGAPWVDNCANDCVVSAQDSCIDGGFNDYSDIGADDDWVYDSTDGDRLDNVLVMPVDGWSGDWFVLVVVGILIDVEFVFFSDVGGPMVWFTFGGGVEPSDSTDPPRVVSLQWMML